MPNAAQTFTGVGGAPLAGGFVYTYVPGTTTPKTTFVDSGQTVPNTNPIQLNANGQGTIWGPSGSYRQVVTDSVGNTIWDQVAFIPASVVVGGAVLSFVPTNGDLMAVSTANVKAVIRTGYAASGDSPPITYTASASACSLNAGAGDNGSQVKSLDNKCWLAETPTTAGGTDIKVYGPSQAARGVFGAAQATTPWTVVMPDSTRLDCTATQASCLDKLFAQMDTISTTLGYYNYGVDIEQQGGYALGTILAINIPSLPLTLPVVRSRHFHWKSINAFGTSGSATSVLRVESALNADIIFEGGQVGANATGNNYTDSTILIAPSELIQPEGFPAIASSTIHLPGISHDASANATFTGSIAGAVLTAGAVTGAPLAAGQVIDAPGAGVLGNTQITGQLTGPAGGAGTYSINQAQAIASKIFNVYTQAQASLHVSAAGGNIIAATIEGNEVNCAGADNVPRCAAAVMVDNPTPTTGSQYVDYRFNYLHNCSGACFNLGANATNAAAIQYNSVKVDQISPSPLGSGASDWGHHNSWDITVDDTNGLVTTGIAFQAGSTKDRVDIRCKGNVSGAGISTCVVIGSGATNHEIHITTEGAVGAAVQDNNPPGTGFNTIWVNGKIWRQPWTPLVAFGGASAGMAYVAQAGTFTYDSGLVTADFNLVFSNKGGSTGAATIGGLAYPANATQTGGCQINFYNVMVGLTGQPWGWLAPGATAIQLVEPGAVTQANLADTNFAATSQVRGTCSYLTD